MKLIRRREDMLDSLRQDSALKGVSFDQLQENYEEVVQQFHSHFATEHRAHFIENAVYHKNRYLALLQEEWGGRVLDVGNDKPFLSFFLDKLHPDAEFTTVSFAVPESPFDLYAVDIEAEALPFDSGSFDQIVFAEVLEHLWRNPSNVAFEFNRVLRQEGRLLLTTPNPCERHAITCILWQANPNQRSQYFRTLESGHVHLWTAREIESLLSSHGFDCAVSTHDFYGYTADVEEIDELIKKISPHPELMGETIVVRATRASYVQQPCYPAELYPDGAPVEFSGALRSFARDNILRLLEEE